MNNNKPFKRSHRIANEMKNAIAEIILSEQLYHPMLKNDSLAITKVEMTDDLKLAKVFITTRDDKYQKEIISVLSFLKNKMISILINKILLKRIPEITFAIDYELLEAEKLISKINKFGL